MPDSKIFRYEIPVDDTEHSYRVPAGKPVLAVNSRDADTVEFWMEVDDKDMIIGRTFKVVNTGQPWDNTYWEYRGTTVSPGKVWVMHLLENI